MSFMIDFSSYMVRKRFAGDAGHRQGAMTQPYSLKIDPAGEAEQPPASTRIPDDTTHRGGPCAFPGGCSGSSELIPISVPGH